MITSRALLQRKTEFPHKFLLFGGNCLELKGVCLEWVKKTLKKGRKIRVFDWSNESGIFEKRLAILRGDFGVIYFKESDGKKLSGLLNVPFDGNLLIIDLESRECLDLDGFLSVDCSTRFVKKFEFLENWCLEREISLDKKVKPIISGFSTADFFKFLSWFAPICGEIKTLSVKLLNFYLFNYVDRSFEAVKILMEHGLKREFKGAILGLHEDYRRFFFVLQRELDRLLVLKSLSNKQLTEFGNRFNINRFQTQWYCDLGKKMFFDEVLRRLKLVLDIRISGLEGNKALSFLMVGW